MQICDAHNDLLMNLNSLQSIENYLFKYCYTNEVVNIFTAFYISPEMQKEKSAGAILKTIEEKFELIKPFKSLTPTLENIGFVKNEEILQKVIKLKPFCATLTWNFDNALAGGAYGTGGLTEWGKFVIHELERNKIIVDTAHLNKQSFLDFVKITKYPIFCSHTSSKEIYGIPRALDAEQLSIIKETNGFVGLCLYNSLLCDGKADLNTILSHIKSMRHYLGDDCLGLGTDFNASGEGNPQKFDIDYNGIPTLLENSIIHFGENFTKQFASSNLQRFINLIK